MKSAFWLPLRSARHKRSLCFAPAAGQQPEHGGESTGCVLLKETPATLEPTRQAAGLHLTAGETQAGDGSAAGQQSHLRMSFTPSGISGPSNPRIHAAAQELPPPRPARVSKRYASTLTQDAAGKRPRPLRRALDLAPRTSTHTATRRPASARVGSLSSGPRPTRRLPYAEDGTHWTALARAWVHR